MPARHAGDHRGDPLGHPGALLPGLIGWGRTAELLLGGQPVDAVEAERWGLVNRAVEEEALDREVQSWIDRFLGLPPDALRLQKALLARWRRVDLDTAVALSTDVFARAYSTGEPRRAMQAFLERRRPVPGARRPDEWTAGHLSPSCPASGS